MPAHAEILSQLLEWANRDDNIRAMWQWGSRADPHREPDQFSDYDIGILTRKSAPLAADESWITQFGSIMIRWPSTPAPTFSTRWLTQLVLFEDGLRIDFQITELPFSLADTQPEPHRVLLDKDGVAEATFANTALPPWITLPDEAMYTARVMSFWWDIVYVPKALAHDELHQTYSRTNELVSHHELKRFDAAISERNWSRLGPRGREPKAPACSAMHASAA